MREPTCGTAESMFHERTQREFVKSILEGEAEAVADDIRAGIRREQKIFFLTPLYQAATSGRDRIASFLIAAG